MMDLNAFDFIRNNLNRIADGIASSDGSYPVWDYKSLLELINALEDEYKKNNISSAQSDAPTNTPTNTPTDYNSRLIDADALERDGWSMSRTFQEDKDTMVYEVKKPSDFPTIEERKHGHWGANGECPFCGYLHQWEDDKFCGNCGARMEG